MRVLKTLFEWISTSLCHLANISYRLGRGIPNDELLAALQSQPEAVDSARRMIENLHVNNVDLAVRPITLGPQLELVPGTESFRSASRYDAGFWANTLLRREYRRPFAVPEHV